MVGEILKSTASYIRKELRARRRAALPDLGAFSAVHGERRVMGVVPSKKVKFKPLTTFSRGVFKK